MTTKRKEEFTVFNPGGKLKEKGPIFRGKANVPDIECQNCGYLIAQGINPEQIRHIFTNCPKCGTLYHFE